MGEATVSLTLTAHEAEVVEIILCDYARILTSSDLPKSRDAAKMADSIRAKIALARG